MVSFLLPHMSNHSTSVWQTGLPQTYNLFGFQDRTGLPGQRSLKGLNCNNLHHSTVAIEIIHILAKLQRKSIITYRCSIKNWGDSVNTAILLILHIMFFSLLSGGQRQEWQWHHGTGASLGHKVGWAPPGQTTPRSTCQESGPSPNVCVSAANGGAQDKDNSATMQGLSLIIRREFQRTQITYQSCNIMQYLDLRQEEQVSLESKSSKDVRQKKNWLAVDHLINFRESSWLHFIYRTPRDMGYIFLSMLTTYDERCVLTAWEKCILTP